MLANLQSTKEILVRKAHCEERIEYYQGQYDMAMDDKGRNKAKRMLDQWRAKLSDVDFKESAAKKYDAIVFASAWNKAKYYDRYRGWQKGIKLQFPGYRRA